MEQRSRLARSIIGGAEFMASGTAYHIVVGNDEHPALTAFARALFGATITGALGFFAVWQGTDDLKVLITSAVVPFLTYMGARFGVEGLIDTAKRNGTVGSRQDDAGR